MIRVADYIMKRIRDEKVSHLFYVPGGQCVYLTDALRRCEGLEGISVHHEQAASMAALAYSQYNENFGACLVTTGCAGTNTITGVLHAWQDSIPCIFISGQQSLNQTIFYEKLPLRQVGVQEANIVEIVKPITKFAAMVEKAEDIAELMDEAIYNAREGRRGPVWIDVPLNIQNEMIDEEKLTRFCIPEKKKLEVSDEEMKYVCECLSNAKRPIIFVGNGVRSANAVNEIQEFINKTRIPAVFTRMASDIVSYDNEMNIGIVCGTGANRSANFAIQNADIVLCLGNRLSIDTTGPQRDEFAREAKIIVVDIDKVEHSKNGVSIDKLIIADAYNFICKILENYNGTADKWWLDKCNYWKKEFKAYDEIEIDNMINIKYFMEKLSEKLPTNSVIMSDAGTTGVTVAPNCHLREDNRLIISFAQGEMGFVLPGSIGVAPISDGMVFAITGDGSLMMNLQELQTLVRNQFNVKIIINNNNGYSGVRHGQKAHFRGKSIGTDPSNGVDFPDYGEIAKAFHIEFDRVESVSQIDEKINKMIETDKPYILEVMCNPDQIEYHNALVTYGKRKFGFRPIEDQSPFLDRETFFKEMIIEPLETSYGKPI